MADTFVVGSIVSIKLKDFMTYDNVEIKPGPVLNVVIGPNGTGKSTIICGICLGLAGKPSILGRAGQAVDFIKQNCKTAHIEITLKGKNGENHAISRVIKRDKSSQWSVNGRPLSQKNVENLVLSLGIQLGNMCQFLPQDKVVEFAKMSPEELLQNTEKTIGDNDLHSKHVQLMQAGNEFRKSEQQLESKQKRLETEKGKESRLKQEVQHYEERQSHLEKLRKLENKRLWLAYDEQRTLSSAEKKKTDEMNLKLKDELDKGRKRICKLQDINTEIEGVKAKIKEKTDSVKKIAQEVAYKNDDIEKLKEKAEMIENELEQKADEDINNRRKINQVQLQLETLQNELESLEEDREDVQPKIEEISKEMRRTNSEMKTYQVKMDKAKQQSLSYGRLIAADQKELEKLKDVYNQRLQNLRNYDNHTYQAVMWLRNNVDKFKAPIHEPAVLTVGVKDKKFATYLEAQVAANDQKAFVCEDPDDCQLFINTMREQGIRLNCVMMPGKPLSSYQPPKDISHYRNYGFYTYMRETLEGDEAVLRYLCELNGIHRIPIGSSETKQRVERVLNNFPELSRFYTEKHQYTVSRSKYGAKNVSSRCSNLRDARSFRITGNALEEGRLIDKIKETKSECLKTDEKLKEIRLMMSKMESNMNKLQQQRKELTEKKNQRLTLEEKIRSKKKSIDRLQGMLIDIDEERDAAKMKKIEIYINRSRIVTQLSDLTQKCVNKSVERMRLHLNQASLTKIRLKFEVQQRTKQAEIEELQAEFSKQKAKSKAMREEGQRLLVAARKGSGVDVPTEEMQREFKNLPTSLPEIDAEIHQIRARADVNTSTDSSVIDTYESHLAYVKTLERELAEMKSSIDNHQSNIDAIRKDWIEPLKNLIGRINDNFRSFFQSLDLAGEVDLKEPDIKEDYDKYGIRIRVKFRDTEDLRELTSTHQSGGERSVATVLYIMALQELTKCPFRCVDEINQGMDPSNERKVFELVTNTVCKKSKAQYFLLTPKLLPNLHFSKQTSILCIYSGPKMMDHKKWNLKKFMKRRRELPRDQ